MKEWVEERKGGRKLEEGGVYIVFKSAEGGILQPVPAPATRGNTGRTIRRPPTL